MEENKIIKYYDNSLSLLYNYIQSLDLGDLKCTKNEYENDIISIEIKPRLLGIERGLYLHLDWCSFTPKGFKEPINGIEVAIRYLIKKPTWFKDWPYGACDCCFIQPCTFLKDVKEYIDQIIPMLQQYNNFITFDSIKNKEHYSKEDVEVISVSQQYHDYLKIIKEKY